MDTWDTVVPCAGLGTLGTGFCTDVACAPERVLGAALGSERDTPLFVTAGEAPVQEPADMPGVVVVVVMAVIKGILDGTELAGGFVEGGTGAVTVEPPTADAVVVVAMAATAGEAALTGEAVGAGFPASERFMPNIRLFGVPKGEPFALRASRSATSCRCCRLSESIMLSILARFFVRGVRPVPPSD